MFFCGGIPVTLVYREHPPHEELSQKNTPNLAPLSSKKKKKYFRPWRFPWRKREMLNLRGLNATWQPLGKTLAKS